MDTTAALIIIILLTFLGVVLVYKGAIHGEDNQALIGFLVLVLALISMTIRSASIKTDNKNKLKQQNIELCIKEGKDAGEIFGQKVCKL